MKRSDKMVWFVELSLGLLQITFQKFCYKDQKIQDEYRGKSKIVINKYIEKTMQEQFEFFQEMLGLLLRQFFSFDWKRVNLTNSFWIDRKPKLRRFDIWSSLLALVKKNFPFWKMLLLVDKFQCIFWLNEFFSFEIYCYIS